MAVPALAAFDIKTGTISNERWASGVPLGGIGCGKLELLTDGGFGFYTGNHNWDLPTGRIKGAFAAVYAESGARKSARMLRLKSDAEYLGVENVAGLDYSGWFPTATLKFNDPALPVKVELLAWSPLIPHDVENSSMPAAVFRYRVTNPGAEPAKAVILMSWPNIIGCGGKSAGWGDPTGTNWDNTVGNQQAFLQYKRSAELLFYRDASSPAPSPNVKGEYLLSVRGEISSTSAARVFECAGTNLPFWTGFSQNGSLTSQATAAKPAGALAATVQLKPGQSRDVEFLLVWHFPDHVITRKSEAPSKEKVVSVSGVNNAIDGKPETRWTTDRSMKPGDAFILELPDVQKVAKLVIDYRGSAKDYPRGYQVELSTDNQDWKKVAGQGSGEMTSPEAGLLTIEFPGQKAKFIRITQLGSVWWYWSINEMAIWDASGKQLAADGWKASASLVKMERVDVSDNAGHYYSKRFKNSREIADYIYKNSETLLARTLDWQNLVRSSNLPDWLKLKLVNCVFPLYHCTLLTRDGRFFVQESPVDMGGALGTMDQRMASHAFYTQMFPELDKTELRIFADCQDLVPGADGQIPHFNGNLHEVLGNPNVGYGIPGWPDLSASWVMQVLKLYRWTGDREFLDAMWPHAKRALAWLKSADRDGDEIPEGGSTYDYEHLPSGAFIYNASCYLGALRAGMAMARVQNDAALEKTYENQFLATQASMMKHLWNGKYFAKHRQSGTGKMNPNSFIAQLAGDWLSRLSGAGRTLPPDITESVIREIIARNVRPFFPVPPMEVTPDGRIAVKPCYILQHEPYAGCEAINEGYTDDGLEVIRRIFEVAWVTNLNPWRGNLDYTAPHGSAGGLIGYMTAPTTWHVLNALSGTTIDVPAAQLTIAPKAGRMLSELHMPIFFSRFWLWMDYVPGRELTLKVIRTFGEPVTIETVRADYESAPVKLPKPFPIKTGKTLDLSRYLDKLVIYSRPKLVDYEVPRFKTDRPGISTFGWSGMSGTADEFFRGGTPGGAFDGDPETRWTTWNRAMRPGDWMCVNMNRIHTVRRIALDSAKLPSDYPRGCTVRVSVDGKDWTVAAELTPAECEAKLKNGVLDIEFKQPAAAQYIKITQNGSVPNITYWSVYELYIYE